MKAGDDCCEATVTITETFEPWPAGNVQVINSCDWVNVGHVKPPTVT